MTNITPGRNLMKSPYEIFQQHIKDSKDDVYDRNANATDTSFSAFLADFSAKCMAQLTKDIILEQAEAIGMPECEMNYFWEHEAHSESGNAKYFYFHDITKGVIPYCYATSTGKILHEGLQYVDDYPSERPKRFDSYIAQVIDLVLEMAQEHAGAIAIPDLFVCMAEFFDSVDSIRAKEYEIANAFQSMIFTFHRKVRPSGQSPFVNVTIADAPTLSAVFSASSSDIEKIKALQVIYLTEFSKGLKGKPFRFPVTTVNIALDTNKDIQDMDWLRSISCFLKSGRFNIYISKDPRKFASCCRMSNDLDLLMDMAGVDSFGNGGVRIGSHRVVTLNLPKIVKDGQDMGAFVKTAVLILKAHREALRKIIGTGKFLKFFKHKWEDLDSNFFSTVGIIGIWEAAKIKTGLEHTPENLPTIIQGIKDIMIEIKQEVEVQARILGMPINIEQVPGESSAADLGKEVGEPILSNQYIPLWEDVSIMDRIKYAGELDDLFTGGAITHLNIEKSLTDENMISIIKAAACAGMTHFAPTHIYSLCENTHSIIGKYKICPLCNGNIKDYVTRIIGYFVPISKWNKARKLEYETRIFKKI